MVIVFKSKYILIANKGLCESHKNKTKDWCISETVFVKVNLFLEMLPQVNQTDLLCPVDEFLAEATLKQNLNETGEPILI